MFASTVACPVICVFGCNVPSCQLQLASTNGVHSIRCGILDSIGPRRTAQICRRACIGVQDRCEFASRSSQLSCIIGRRRRWRLRCRRAEWLDRGRDAPPILRRFRGEHGCLDCTICISRSGLRRDICETFTPAASPKTCSTGQASSMLYSDRAFLEIRSCANSSRAMSDQTCSQQSPPNTPRAEDFSS